MAGVYALVLRQEKLQVCGYTCGRQSVGAVADLSAWFQPTGQLTDFDLIDFNQRQLAPAVQK